MSFNKISGMKRLLFTAVIAASFPCIPASAEPLKSSAFLQYDEASRQWWYKGAMEMLAHSMSQIDKAKADCIADWYFPHKDERNKEIEETLAKYPDHAASSIVLALVQKQCGKIGQ